MKSPSRQSSHFGIWESLLPWLRFVADHRLTVACSAAALLLIASSLRPDLWLTADQQGQRLMDAERFEEAAEAFRDPARQGVAWFRAGEFERAEQAFARVQTAESEFNRGNCLIMLGKYEAAIAEFDRALRLHPGWQDAETNRAIAVAREKRLGQKGGDMGDQRLGADEIVFDNDSRSGGQDTNVADEQPLSNSAMQALWLRRVQTRPADFLKAKFAYQLANVETGGAP